MINLIIPPPPSSPPSPPPNPTPTPTPPPTFFYIDGTKGRRAGAALLMASMALLALQPTAITMVWGSAAGGGNGVGMGGGGGEWMEAVKQACGVCVASAGVLAVTGVVSVTR